MVEYSTAQKLSLAGMAIGAIMVGVGGCAPFWLITDPEGFGFWGDLIGSVVTANMGPFVYCFELLGKSDCAMFSLGSSQSVSLATSALSTSDDTSLDWFMVVRYTVAACVFVGVMCGMTALCVACCSCCDRFIVLGLMAFGAACCGGFGGAVWYMRTDDFVKGILGFKVFSLGWAFFVFGAGAGLLGLVSFVACFASPERPNNRVTQGMMLQPTTVIATHGHPPGAYPAGPSSAAGPPPVMYMPPPGAAHPLGVPGEGGSKF